MIRLFHTLKTSLVALAISALIFLPSFYPAFASDRDADKSCKTARERCTTLNQRHKRNGKWIVSGIIGLAPGGAIINKMRRLNRDQNAKQQKSTKPKQAHTGHKGDVKPWTPGWYRWCANRYRSFNPKTGTYRGYDGRNYFCVVK